jgi:hypothetical protein
MDELPIGSARQTSPWVFIWGPLAAGAVASLTACLAFLAFEANPPADATSTAVIGELGSAAVLGLLALLGASIAVGFSTRDLALGLVASLWSAIGGIFVAFGILAAVDRLT